VCCGGGGIGNKAAVFCLLPSSSYPLFQLFTPTELHIVLQTKGGLFNVLARPLATNLKTTIINALQTAPQLSVPRNEQTTNPHGCCRSAAVLPRPFRGPGRAYAGIDLHGLRPAARTPDVCPRSPGMHSGSPPPLPSSPPPSCLHLQWGI